MVKHLQRWRLVCIFTFIQGVSATEARDALIASGCVVGALLLFSILLCVFCYLRIKKRANEKSPPNTYHNGTIPRSVHIGPRALEHQTFRGKPDVVVANGTSVRAKAFTQHAAGPRQRPPVVYYTVTADPRMVSSNGIPLATAHSHRALGHVKRPVLLVDWNINGVRKQNANGGPLIQELQPHGSKASRKHKSNERDQRARSKSRSGSRARAYGARNRRSTRSHGDATVRHAEGDVILTSQSADIDKYSRDAARQSKRRSDNNNNNKQVNNPLNKYFVNGNQKMGDERKTTRDGMRYSITQVHTSSHAVPSVSHGLNTLLQEKEQTMGFGEEVESFPEPTPRIDYSRDSSQAVGVSDFSFDVNPKPDGYLNNGFVGDEPTPRADYSARETDTNVDTLDGGMDDIIALGNVKTEHTYVKRIEREEVFQRSHRQNPHLGRPPTPPFDGISPRELEQYSKEENGSRQVSRRPPTPPPGKIIYNPDISIDDILKKGSTQAPRPPDLPKDVKSSQGSQAVDAGLPFLAELLSRAKSVDLGDPRDTTGHVDPTYQRIITNDDRDDGRQSAVHFTRAPPQIIPRSTDDPLSPSPTEDKELPFTSSVPRSAGIPPPPPLPQAPRPLNSENQVLY